MPQRFEALKRISLPVQVAGALRDNLNRGVWTRQLPSLRELSRALQVSIPTLQAAARVLATEGLVQISPRRRIQIRRETRSPSARRMVVFIECERPATLSDRDRVAVSEMRAQLEKRGFFTELLFPAARSVKTQRGRIEAFLIRHRPAWCVLLAATRELQEWFMACPVPTLVFGTCHPSVRLPSLDVNYRALCRHAAGELVRKGHRRIALLVPNSGCSGDLDSEEGFHEGAEDKAEVVIARHQGSARSINAKLGLWLESGSPPTALVVAKPQCVFITMVFLLNRGLKVPQDVSLVARDWSGDFETSIPVISHYKPDDASCARQASRFVIRMVDRGYLAPNPHFIMPQFVAGGSVRRI